MAGQDRAVAEKGESLFADRDLRPWHEPPIRPYRESDQEKGDPMRFRPAIDSRTGEIYLPVSERGRGLLEEPLLNKGTAFSAEEREMFALRGFLPAHTCTMDEQLTRVRMALDSKSTPMEKHVR